MGKVIFAHEHINSVHLCSIGQGESGRVKGSLRRASPALDPTRFTRKRNSQTAESGHINTFCTYSWPK